MYLVNKIFVRLFGTYIGEDKQGNLYYSLQKRNSKKHCKISKNASLNLEKCPWDWYCWLHKIYDILPYERTVEQKSIKNYNPKVFSERDVLYCYYKWIPK